MRARPAYYFLARGPWELGIGWQAPRTPPPL